MTNINLLKLNEEEVVKEIISSIGNIRYGSVEIIIHDSKVVQIERKEKLRFEKRKL